MKKLLAAAALAAVALVALLSRPAPERRSLRFGGSDEPGTLDPQTIDWGEQARISWCLFDNLVAYGPDDTSLVPALAEKWTVSDDGLRWDFALRSDVVFHDGTPFTAEAVVFAFERMREGHPFAPAVRPYAHHYEVIESVETVDPHTARFRLREPSAVFLRDLAMFPAGIPSPAAVKARGAAAFGLHPVGTGRYRLKEWRANEKIVLERFAGYWGAPAREAQVIVLPIKDPAVRVEQLLAGHLDAVDIISMADLGRLEQDPAIEVSYEESMNVGYLGFNMNVAPYSDVNFRRAVACAIDRPKLNAVAFFGQAVDAVSILPPAIEGHAADLPPPAHDPARARELLAKVPHLPAEVELWHMNFSRPYFPDPDKVAECLKADLEAVGLKVRLSGYPRDSYGQKTMDPGHPMFLMGWSTDNADPDNFLYTLLHASAIPGNNRTFFDHAEFNDVTRRAQTERDPARRRALYRRAQEIHRDELPSIPLAHVRQAAAARRPFRFNLHPIETRLWTIGREP